MKGLIQWTHGLYWQAGEYIMNILFTVFNMDMEYFENAIPVSTVILDVMLGVGWALLLGNLVFQAAKTMMTGLGFEGDDPKTLALRTFVFSFLLLASRQICGVGLSLGSTVVQFLQMPDSVILPEMQEDMFGIDASWLIVVIVGVIIIFQFVKFFFEVGERYVIVGILTILSPLAFAMGGSKITADIFKGWARMYGSMCLMMVLNVIFMKLIVSAMATFPTGMEVFPWLILMVALARVARKIDSVIARIGLNPAITGDGLGRGIPGMLMLMAGKQIASTVINSKVGAAGMAAKAGSKAAGAAAGMAGAAAGFAGRSQSGTSPINTNGGGSPPSSTKGTPANPPIGRNSPATQGTQGSHTQSTRQPPSKQNGSAVPQQSSTQHPQPGAQQSQSGTSNTGGVSNSPIDTGSKSPAPAKPPIQRGNITASPVDTSSQTKHPHALQHQTRTFPAGEVQPVQTHGNAQSATQSNQVRQDQQSQTRPAGGSTSIAVGETKPTATHPISAPASAKTPTANPAPVSAPKQSAPPTSYKPGNDNIALQLQQAARSQSTAPKSKSKASKKHGKPIVDPPMSPSSRADSRSPVARDIAAGGTPVPAPIDTKPNRGDNS